MKRQTKFMIAAIVTIFFVTGIYLYNNFRNEKIVISSNGKELYKTVTLQENNCNAITENNVTTIEKYNGSANTIIINGDILDGNTLEINSNAFLECSNLDTILIDKTIANTDYKIENFEINTENQDEQYIEYKNTQNYSEAYKLYLELSEEEKNKLEIIPEKYNIPMSALNLQSNNDEITIPEKFDLRDKINIKVEHQGNLGICYAFASLTAVETNLALRHNDFVDLSEVHLASNTYGFTAGGSFIHAYDEYYRNKIGPVYQSDGLAQNVTAKRYVKETVSFPTIDKSYIYPEQELSKARNAIKTHIMQYGSLYASISSTIEKNDNDIYVLNAKFPNLQDHAVSIIGWDDKFSKDNFPISNRPSTDGAYLAVNSWGEGWGDNGCFWISYEDYWVEMSLRGVKTVDTCQENINIEDVIITDKNDNSEISYKITKGINAQIEIDVNVNEIINNEEQVEINVISPNGKDITNEMQISGNKINENKAEILLGINTSVLSTGEYTIKIKYHDEILLVPIVIKIDTYDFEIKEDGNINITGYYGKDKKIIIPQEFFGFSVTGIRSRAFRNNDLESITIYENITEVGENIIDTSVIIYGNTQTYIEQYANENGYIFLDLNEKVIERQGWYFDAEDHKLFITENYNNKEYDYLKNVIYKIEVRNSIQEIFSSQFQGYVNLEEVILPESVTFIGEKAFGECYSLKTINLPQNITRIEEQTFYSCKSLETINIPDGVTVIGSGAFNDCTNLKNINIPNGVTVISDYLFYMCSSLKNINIPEGVKGIGSFAFFKCINLESINIPEGVTNIGDAAFYECKSFKDLNIPSTVTTIGFNVFNECIINKVVEVGNTEMQLPDIIKRAITSGDVLSCGTGISVKNGKIKADKSSLEITPGFGQILITISSGNLSGLKVSIIASGVIEYSEDYWTYDDVTATLYIGKGEYVVNNGGEQVYIFSENGEFEFEYVNLNGENKKVTAKVDIIDKALPSITAIATKNEQGFIENITANISDEQAGLWSQTVIGYAWSKSDIIQPTDWITAEIPSFADETKQISFEIDITGMSGKYYLWIYKKQFYDMAANGFENKWDLISNEPYYLGNEPILQGITIINPPKRTVYIAGEDFKIEGLRVAEKYNNGTQIEITDYEVIDKENLNKDKTFVTINYNKNDEIFTTIQEITVYEKLEVTSEKYHVQDKNVLKILPGTTVKEIYENLQCNMKFEILDLEGQVVEETELIGTRYKVKMEHGEEYTLIVCGDFTGDGKISIAELARVSRIAVQTEEPTLQEKLIIDVSLDGKIMINDLAAIARLALK